MVPARRDVLRGCLAACIPLLGAGCQHTSSSARTGDQSGCGDVVRIERVRANFEYYLVLRYDGNTVRTETFEAGSTQENLEIELDPPIEHDTTVEMAVYSADEEEEEGVDADLEYTIAPDCVPVPVLVADDQSGDGETLTVSEVGAGVDYYVDVHYGGESVETETFDAHTTQEDLDVDLDPPIESDTTVLVVAHAAEDDDELAVEEVEYTVE